ncbi:MAG: Uma2 family endonuclease [Gemmataceae bacterium]|nr:Uma2 family endonuclease [Gemmataceae bacterium]
MRQTGNPGQAGFPDSLLQMGVRLVWVIDPQRLRVTVFQPDQEPTVLAPANDLDGGDILPGFCCRVLDLFA